VRSENVVRFEIFTVVFGGQILTLKTVAASSSETLMVIRPFDTTHPF
jgi:hypothetical protein